MAEQISQFDLLNNALFLQMEKLQDAPKDELADTIEQSKAVSQLAKNIINNMNAAMTLAKMKIDADAMLGNDAGRAFEQTRMLGGGCSR